MERNLSFDKTQLSGDDSLGKHSRSEATGLGISEVYTPQGEKMGTSHHPQWRQASRGFIFRRGAGDLRIARAEMEEGVVSLHQTLGSLLLGERPQNLL
jgi:hypothetical protein